MCWSFVFAQTMPPCVYASSAPFLGCPHSSCLCTTQAKDVISAFHSGQTRNTYHLLCSREGFAVRLNRIRMRCTSADTFFRGEAETQAVRPITLHLTPLPWKCRKFNIDVPCLAQLHAPSPAQKSFRRFNARVQLCPHQFPTIQPFVNLSCPPLHPQRALVAQPAQLFPLAHQKSAFTGSPRAPIASATQAANQSP